MLLTIQGNMLTAATGNLGEAQRAVLEASARGGSSLEILRCLLGRPGASAADPGALLEQVAELVRVPMREAQQLLELRLPAGGPFACVDSAAFVILVVEGLRHVVAAVPKGVRGTIVLELAAAAAGPTVVRTQFVSSIGELPFPLPVAELQQTLGARAQQLRAGVSCRVLGQAIELEWQGGAVSRHHEA